MPVGDVGARPYPAVAAGPKGVIPPDVCGPICNDRLAVRLLNCVAAAAAGTPSTGSGCESCCCGGCCSSRAASAACATAAKSADPGSGPERLYCTGATTGVAATGAAGLASSRDVLCAPGPAAAFLSAMARFARAAFRDITAAKAAAEPECAMRLRLALLSDVGSSPEELRELSSS